MGISQARPGLQSQILLMICNSLSIYNFIIFSTQPSLIAFYCLFIILLVSLWVRSQELLQQAEQEVEMWDNQASLNQNILISSLNKIIFTLQSSFNIFLDAVIIVNFVRNKNFLPGVGDLKLIRYFISILVFHLFFGLENQFEGISQGWFITTRVNIEMSVAYFSSMHNKIVEVKVFIVWFEIQSSKSNQWHRISIIQIYNWIDIHFQNLQLIPMPNLCQFQKKFIQSFDSLSNFGCSFPLKICTSCDLIIYCQHFPHQQQNITAISVIVQLMSSINQMSISSSSQSESQLSLPTHNIKYRNYSPNSILQPALNQLENLPNQDDIEIKNRNQIIVIDDEDEVQDREEANQNEQELLDVVQIQREQFRSNTNHLKKLMNKGFQKTQQANRSKLKVEQKRENLEREYQKSIGSVQQQENADQINQNLILISSGGLVNSNEEAQMSNSIAAHLINSEQKIEVNQRIYYKQVLNEFIQRSNSQTPKFKCSEQNFLMGVIDMKKNILTDQDLTEEQIEKLQNLTQFKANIFITKLFVVNIYLLTQLIQYFGRQSNTNRNQSDLKDIQPFYFNERISNQTVQDDDDVGNKWKLTETRQNMLSFMYTFLEAINFTDNGLLKLFIYRCNSSQIQQIYKTILLEIKANVQQISNLKKMNQQSVQYCLKKILSIPFFQKPKSEKQMENFLKEFYLYNPISINPKQLPEDKNKTKSQSNNKRSIYPKNTIFLNEQDKIKQKSSHLSKKSSKKQQISKVQGVPKSQTYKILEKEKEKQRSQQQRVQKGKAKQSASSEFPKRKILITLGDYSTYGTQEKKKSQAQEEIEEGEIVELSQPAKKKH